MLSDLTMPAMDGLALLEEVRARHPGTLFVLVTAHGDERTAVRALHDESRRRAAPVRGPQLLSATARALDLHRQSLQKRLRALDLTREVPGEGPGAAE